MSANHLSACPTEEELEACLDTDTGKAAHTHIAKCAACRDRLSDMRRNNELMREVIEVAREASAPAHAAALPSPGHVEVKGYEVLSEIHRGGQGIVYKALQQNPHRIVALKVLLEGRLASPARRRRFEREIEIVATLRHPFIVTVYDSGLTTDGRLFFSMEYVEGLPLDRYVLRQTSEVQSTAGLIPQKSALQLFCDICEGVNHAHQRGVIHRDLKPSNIIIDDQGRPHIVDFGLAKAIAGSDRSDSLVTAAGQFMGTLAYAAPEQVRGNPDAIDIRTDVYALGVILYELLAGVLPGRVDGPISDTIRAITDLEPAPPSSLLTGRRIEKGATDLDTIVLKALSKNPERRYQTTAALAEDIRRFVRGEAIDARRDSGWYVLRKTLARYRVHTAIAAAFVVLLLAFGVSMSLMYRRSVIEAEKNRQIRIFLEDTLGSVGPGPEGADVPVRRVLDEAVHWVEIALAGQPEVEASLRLTIGNSYRSLGLYDRAQEQLDHALRLHESTLGDDHPGVAASLNALGTLARDRGDMLKAEQLYRRALDIRRESLGNDHLDVSNSLQNVGTLAELQGQYEVCESYLRESLAIRRRILPASHPDVAMSLFKLARVVTSVGRLEEAEAMHREALAMRLALLHEEHPDVTRSMTALAELLLEQKETEEARLMLTRCLAIQQRSLAKGDWRIGATQALLQRCAGEAEK